MIIESFIIIGIALCVGALVQGCVGFGVGVFGAPIVAAVDPSLMPELVLVVGVVLPVVMLRGEWRSADFHGLRWALLGRFPGVVAGVYVVVVRSAEELGVVIALAVMLAVALSLVSVRLPKTPAVLTSVGAISGLTGTAAGIGGPPMAVVYQDGEGHEVRATLSAFFALGAAVSLALLALAGEVGQRAVLSGLAMMPFIILGYASAIPLKTRFDTGLMRTTVLLVASLSSIVLLLRSVT